MDSQQPTTHTFHAIRRKKARVCASTGEQELGFRAGNTFWWSRERDGWLWSLAVLRTEDVCISCTSPECTLRTSYTITVVLPLLLLLFSLLLLLDPRGGARQRMYRCIYSLQYCTPYSVRVVIAINAYHIGQAPLLFLKGGRASTPTKHQVSLPCRRGIRAVKDLAHQRHGEKTNKGKKRTLYFVHTRKKYWGSDIFSENHTYLIHRYPVRRAYDYLHVVLRTGSSYSHHPLQTYMCGARSACPQRVFVDLRIYIVAHRLSDRIGP